MKKVYERLEVDVVLMPNQDVLAASAITAGGFKPSWLDDSGGEGYDVGGES